MWQMQGPDVANTGPCPPDTHVYICAFCIASRTLYAYQGTGPRFSQKGEVLLVSQHEVIVKGDVVQHQVWQFDREVGDWTTEAKILCAREKLSRLSI